jgi:hypothetical protein
VDGYGLSPVSRIFAPQQHKYLLNVRILQSNFIKHEFPEANGALNKAAFFASY